MKVGLILFHKKIPIIYKIDWITLCLETLNSQTYQDFDILECNYGEENISLCEIYDYLFKEKKKFFWHKQLKNHVHAQNFLLNKAFKEMDLYKLVGFLFSTSQITCNHINETHFNFWIFLFSFL